MADEKTEEKPQEKLPEVPAENQAKQKETKLKKSSILPYIIIGVIILIAAGTGVGLSRLLAGGGKQSSEEEMKAEEESPHETEKSAGHGEKKSEKPVVKEGEVWYFTLEPVVANLDEPGATRYIRTAFILEMSPEFNAEKGTLLLEQKKPLIANMLTIYLSGLNIESTRGDKNLKRIQSELCDTFNEQLFSDSKPMVKRVLIKEFAVQ